MDTRQQMCHKFRNMSTGKSVWFLCEGEVGNMKKSTHINTNSISESGGVHVLSFRPFGGTSRVQTRFCFLLFWNMCSDSLCFCLNHLKQPRETLRSCDVIRLLSPEACGMFGSSVHLDLPLKLHPFSGDQDEEPVSANKVTFFSEAAKPSRLA